jgi:SH3-like domain-containing protein
MQEFTQRQKITNFIFAFLIITQLAMPEIGICEFNIIHGDKAALHDKPDQKAKILWEYGEGFPVEIIKKKGEWTMVRDFEKDKGWIHKSRLIKGKNVIVKSNKNDEKPINIRNSPKVDSQIIGNAYYGVVFLLLNRKTTWIEVRHESGLTGWIKSEFVWGL